MLQNHIQTHLNEGCTCVLSVQYDKRNRISRFRYTNRPRFKLWFIFNNTLMVTVPPSFNFIFLLFQIHFSVNQRIVHWLDVFQFCFFFFLLFYFKQTWEVSLCSIAIWTCASFYRPFEVAEPIVAKKATKPNCQASFLHKFQVFFNYLFFRFY